MTLIQYEESEQLGRSSAMEISTQADLTGGQVYIITSQRQKDPHPAPSTSTISRLTTLPGGQRCLYSGGYSETQMCSATDRQKKESCSHFESRAKVWSCSHEALQQPPPHIYMHFLPKMAQGHKLACLITNMSFEWFTSLRPSAV